MNSLRIFPPLVNFSVIALIGIRTINTQCFNVIDVNLSLIALIFSVFTEIILLKKLSS